MVHAAPSRSRSTLIDHLDRVMPGERATDSGFARHDVLGWEIWRSDRWPDT
jgi:hypothetical protein